MSDDPDVPNMTNAEIHAWVQERLQGLLTGMPAADLSVAETWIRHALESGPDSLSGGLLLNLLSGDAELRVINGKPAFRLTPKGVAKGQHLAMTNAQFQAQLAALWGDTFVPPPEKPQ